MLLAPAVCSPHTMCVSFWCCCSLLALLTVLGYCWTWDNTVDLLFWRILTTHCYSKSNALVCGQRVMHMCLFLSHVLAMAGGQRLHVTLTHLWGHTQLVGSFLQSARSGQPRAVHSNRICLFLFHTYAVHGNSWTSKSGWGPAGVRVRVLIRHQCGALAASGCSEIVLLPYV